jgi:hypothetical protein
MTALCDFCSLDFASLGVGWDLYNRVHHAEDLKTHIALD